MPAGRIDAARRTVLVVQDGSGGHALCASLEAEGLRASPAGSVDDAIGRVSRELPDLLVLDAVAVERFELLKDIRATSDVPVIVLGPADEAAAVRYLDGGADDFLVRPYSVRALTSRIQAVLRRAELPPPVSREIVYVDDYLQIDFRRRLVFAGGREVQLRPTEYRLLYHLVNYAGRTLAHPTLLAKVWGFEQRDQSHYLRLYVRYLREKIEPNPANPRYILTERGLGYRFREF